MSDNNAKDQKGFDCPTCGDTFKNEYGVNVHHAKIHNESLTKLTVECDVCGEKIERYKNKVERSKRTFCGDKCEGVWRSEYQQGDNHHNKVEKITVKCDTCGKELERYPRRVDENDKHYCSDECRGVGQSKRQTGKDNPNWNPEIDERECEVCGEPFTPHHSNQLGKFCSKECKGKWMSENWVGENHPGWKGGTDNYYGDNWYKQKKKARERDNFTCQACGYQPDEGIGDLQVHHIRKLNWYKERYDKPTWWELGNKLDNLVTLCQPCHNKWEGIPLKPQTIKRNDG